jgi:predicted nucleotidyltransferase
VVPTGETQALRAVVETHRADIQAVLDRYDAHNPRLFGSVARGTLVLEAILT